MQFLDKSKPQILPELSPPLVLGLFEGESSIKPDTIGRSKYIDLNLSEGPQWRFCCVLPVFCMKHIIPLFRILLRLQITPFTIKLCLNKHFNRFGCGSEEGSERAPFDSVPRSR